ncbi:MAG: magnesium transporter CorA, partial [Firmicutes bacterium]|nr:magnesium transporter CorA [Bacillota bacterium]
MTQCVPEEFFAEGAEKPGQYVAALTPGEWAEKRGQFGISLEQDPAMSETVSTKAEVNYDSLTGSFLIPDRGALDGKEWRFSFALDGKGIVFIDPSGKAEEMIDSIAKSKHSDRPCLERFLYDFLEEIVKDDLHIMEKMEKELDDFEDRILAEEDRLDLGRINRMRAQMRELRIHYEQLIDMTQELEENENGFFKEKDLRYLHLFMNRMLRLSDIAASVRDHTTQVRELYQTQLDVRQNRTMTLLTVIATIFMPLTLITSWYGMNFRHMPELEYTWSYPAVLVICV